MIQPSGPFTSLPTLVALAQLRSLNGLYSGQVNDRNRRLIGLCSHVLMIDRERYATVIYTRDAGHHSGGWWKNPAYERCLHLSLGYRLRLDGSTAPHDRRRSEILARAFFGDAARLAWIEGPASDDGRARDVWHYRVFCDPSWSPILPHGEIYSREDTPSGWQSFSDLHSPRLNTVDAPFLLAVSDTGV